MSIIIIIIILITYRNGAQTHFADSGGSTAFHLAAGSQNYKYVHMNMYTICF